jgi:hypothetical protein
MNFYKVMIRLQLLYNFCTTPTFFFSEKSLDILHVGLT